MSERLFIVILAFIIGGLIMILQFIGFEIIRTIEERYLQCSSDIISSLPICYDFKSIGIRGI